MQAVRNLTKLAPVAKSAIQPQRCMSAVSTPARNKVSTAETIILAACMVVGWTATPAWVLLHMNEYRDHDK